MEGELVGQTKYQGGKVTLLLGRKHTHTRSAHTTHVHPLACLRSLSPNPSPFSSIPPPSPQLRRGLVPLLHLLRSPTLGRPAEHQPRALARRLGPDRWSGQGAGLEWRVV